MRRLKSPFQPHRNSRRRVRSNTAILVTVSLVTVSLVTFCLSQLGISAEPSQKTDPLPVWPDLAPGETTRETGTLQPFRASETPPVSRVTKIRRPTMDVFLPASPNGSAILILPGGGFGKVVPDKEGSEAAPWLNRLGIATFVLRYRTNEATPKGEPAWRRPLQDSQRALRLIRSRAAAWKIDPQRVGVLGFSAGGQVAAILHTRADKVDYQAMDDVDRYSSSPNFSLLIYPWRILQSDQKLLDEIRIGADTPPAFLVHTHDDASSSLGSVLTYAGLKSHGIDAELHVYRNGGHGYGMRAVPGSSIGTWPDRATDWLIGRGLAQRKPAAPPSVADQ